jgi:hypothetical protein
MTAHKLFYMAGAGAIIAVALLVATIASAIGFGGAVGWPMFVFFLIMAVASGLTALFAAYTEDNE